MLVECSHCGAPLDVQSRARVVACAYCNRQHKLPRMKTLSPDTPAGFQPPTVWTPPAQARARSRPLRFHPVKVVAGLVVTLGRVIKTGLTLAMLLPALYFAYQQTRALHGGHGAAAGLDAAGLGELSELASRVLPADKLQQVKDAVGDLGQQVLPSWDGQAPFRCSGNQQITLRDVRASLPDRGAVVVEANCRLHLIDSEIEAWNGVTVTNNGRLLLERTRITTTGNAVDLQHNARLELVDSQLRSDDTAIAMAHNARITLSSGRVEGKKAAVSLLNNANGEVRTAEIVGKVRGRKSRLKGLPSTK